MPVSYPKKSNMGTWIRNLSLKYKFWAVNQVAFVTTLLLVLFAGTCWGLGSYIQPRLWLPVTTTQSGLNGSITMILSWITAWPNLYISFSQ